MFDSDEEKNNPWADHDHPGEETENVCLPGVQGPQGCVQTVIFYGFWIFSQIDFCSYASLYFCCAIEQSDNDLICLEIIHRYVEILDKYFGSVSGKQNQVNDLFCLGLRTGHHF